MYQHAVWAHSLLQKIKQLLDTLVHTAGISLQHQLRSLGLLVLWVDSCEPYNDNINACKLGQLFKKMNQSLTDMNQSVTGINQLVTATDRSMTDIKAISEGYESADDGLEFIGDCNESLCDMSQSNESISNSYDPIGDWYKSVGWMVTNQTVCLFSTNSRASGFSYTELIPVNPTMTTNAYHLSHQSVMDLN